MPLSDLSSSHGSVVNLLRSLFFFADLPGPELAALAQQALRRTFDPGQMIFLEGEPSAGLWIIDSGTVKVFKLAADGREHVLPARWPPSRYPTKSSWSPVRMMTIHQI